MNQAPQETITAAECAELLRLARKLHATICAQVNSPSVTLEVRIATGESWDESQFKAFTYDGPSVLFFKANSAPELLASIGGGIVAEQEAA